MSRPDLFNEKIRMMSNTAPRPNRNRPMKNLDPFLQKALDFLSYEQWKIAEGVVSDQTLEKLWSKGLIQRQINPKYHKSEDIFGADPSSKYFQWRRRKA